MKKGDNLRVPHGVLGVKTLENLGTFTRSKIFIPAPVIKDKGLQSGIFKRVKEIRHSLVLNESLLFDNPPIFIENFTFLVFSLFWETSSAL